MLGIIMVATVPARDKKMKTARDIKDESTAAPIELCPERAYLVTEFFRKHDDPEEPVIIRQARALAYLLSHKEIHIYPGELILGNAGTARRSCIMQPELASAFMATELLWINRRKTTPFKISLRDRLKLATRVIPYWLLHSMPIRMFPNPSKAVKYSLDQLKPTYYLINEAGGIGHFLPNYEKMLLLGTRGYLDSFEDKDGDLYTAVRIVCEALEEWSDRIAEAALSEARATGDTERREELQEMARVCRRVPREPAATFHEALQSLWLTHLGVMLESLNSAVSFGRIDQYLYPYYRDDLDEGRLTRERALQLLLQFSIKTTEHVMLLSERISEYHGGFLIVQAAIVGGTDGEGEDATNPLTYLMLDVMERHRMRDPNYQARVHSGSPPEFLARALDVARQGYGVPALFNDEAVVPSLVAHGFPVEDARDYGIVGCVEPSIPGRSFMSTDAGLFNIPICLELALNRGHRWGHRLRTGAPTPDPSGFGSMDDVIEVFRTQLNFMVDRMIDDFHMVEKANIDYHPTPLSSMLVDGCLESGLDLTEGGARYNSSGIQGVGVADVADSLAALDSVVFREGKLSMDEVLEALRDNFEGHEVVRAELEGAPKYGNDVELADKYADLVVTMFHNSLARHVSMRGGGYVPGFYTVTCHVAFGGLTGPLPSGRASGEPFASGIGPAANADRRGPTALLNSVSAIDSTLMPNCNALNMRFDPADISGDRGLEVLTGLAKGFFERRGMQIQLNVLDPDTLEDARAHPGTHPGLVVRVAGYCALFDDLPDSAKSEIVKRTRLKA
ncbi:MAG: formate acetyltransferase [Actinobacteria bacterium]|nr:formate acetyltransferase [Actinomycetota bacterium]MCG2817528.1 formate acetyltransferase [Actinomycetes bacterium]MBU4219819.1 formate acetyltransferase [Actinomycetota bacterium]MBU4358903.1 formate acetyltransferase [Actinomycetota bacterium]MBU4403356.1 formate acetyltransferase [Actinomycetota bacterium]